MFRSVIAVSEQRSPRPGQDGDMTTFLHGGEHVRQYQETDGEDGYHWRNGTTILLLTTTGRKSG